MGPGPVQGQGLAEANEVAFRTPPGPSRPGVRDPLRPLQGLAHMSDYAVHVTVADLPDLLRRILYC